MRVVCKTERHLTTRVGRLTVRRRSRQARTAGRPYYPLDAALLERHIAFPTPVLTPGTTPCLVILPREPPSAIAARSTLHASWR